MLFCLGIARSTWQLCCTSRSKSIHFPPCEYNEFALVFHADEVRTTSASFIEFQAVRPLRVMYYFLTENIRSFFFVSAWYPCRLVAVRELLFRFKWETILCAWVDEDEVSIWNSGRSKMCSPLCRPRTTKFSSKSPIFFPDLFSSIVVVSSVLSSFFLYCHAFYVEHLNMLRTNKVIVRYLVYV